MRSYIDMHCDSLLRILEQGESSLHDGKGMQSILNIVEAGQMCQFFAVFMRPCWKETEPDMYFEHLRNALYEQAEAHGDVIAMAHNYEQIQENRRAGRASAILTMEDGRMVQGRMEKLQALYAKGVRAMTLTWNMPNCFGYPHTEDRGGMQKGLTTFGKEAVEEMNRLGMLIDVSHLSDGGFWDVAALSEKPFIASHSNCRALTPHTRNLTDDMIVLLADKGGVAGLNLCPEFVSRVRKNEAAAMRSSVEDLAAHVLHFINVGGEECVGIGSDFDGIEGELEIDCPTKMELLFEELTKRGVTSRQLDKLAYENVLRVIKEGMK